MISSGMSMWLQNLIQHESIQDQIYAISGHLILPVCHTHSLCLPYELDSN